MAEDIINKTQKRMEKSLDSLTEQLGKIRAGRANASILNGITVEYYGSQVPINQVASISIPEARVILITPFDKSVLKELERSLLASDIGINPTNDGKVIRLVIPQLTGDRRKEIAKQVNGIAEEAKIAVRNIRRDSMNELKKEQKNDDINDDEFHDLEDQVQKVTDKNIKGIDKIAADKSKEIVNG